MFIKGKQSPSKSHLTSAIAVPIQANNVPNVSIHRPIELTWYTTITIAIQSTYYIFHFPYRVSTCGTRNLSNIPIYTTIVKLYIMPSSQRNSYCN